MMNKFARNIADDVKSEILLAEAREAEGLASNCVSAFRKCSCIRPRVDLVACKSALPDVVVGCSAK